MLNEKKEAVQLSFDLLIEKCILRIMCLEMLEIDLTSIIEHFATAATETIVEAGHPGANQGETKQ